MALSDTACRGAKGRETEYKLSDGGGLYLLVKPSGARLWNQAYRFSGKQKKLSHGVYPSVTLAEARRLEREDPDVGDRRRAVSDSHGQVDEHLAAVMSATPPLRGLHRVR